MKTIKTIMKVLFASALLLPFAAQSAYDDCNAEIIAVGKAIDYAEFTGKRADSDRSNLLTKLTAAEAKISQDKFSDAIDKFDNISDKATDMANAPKSKLESAYDINNAVTDALECVGPLQLTVE